MNEEYDMNEKFDMDAAIDAALEELSDDRPSFDKENYLPLDALIREYPEGVSITGVYRGTNEEGEVFHSLTFAEAQQKYFSGASGDLKKMVDKLLAISDGNLKELNKCLQARPRKIKIWKTKTKTKKTYVKVMSVEASP